MAGKNGVSNRGGSPPAPDGNAGPDGAETPLAGSLSRTPSVSATGPLKLIGQADLERLREDGTISEDFMQVLLDMQAEERSDALSRVTGGGLAKEDAPAAPPAPEKD
jgi:hypothetical protein